MTPTPKEGPPTLRECREALKNSEWTHIEQECPCCGAFKEYDPNDTYANQHEDDCILKKSLYGLTDEALERDERRTKIIRWIINCIDVADKIKYGTDDHRYALAAIRLHRSKLQELDALAAEEKS